MTEPTKAVKSTAGKEPRKTYLYIGYTESGDWDTFSDELEASRYALKGAKARVEKRELLKRSK